MFEWNCQWRPHQAVSFQWLYLRDIYLRFGTLITIPPLSVATASVKSTFNTCSSCVIHCVIIIFGSKLDRSKNMMRRPRCMYCIPVDTGSFILGLLSSLISGSGVIIMTLAQVWLSTVSVKKGEPFDYTNNDWDELTIFDSRRRLVDFLATFAVVMLIYIVSLTSFIFSVFLCYGTHKRRSGFVKAYLIYGVVLTILMMIGAILYSWNMSDIIGGSVMLMICGVYSMLLLMVQRAHELIRAEKACNHAQLLSDPEPCLKA